MKYSITEIGMLEVQSGVLSRSRPVGSLSILEHLAEVEEADLNELVQLTGKRSVITQNILERLRSQGLVERTDLSALQSRIASRRDRQFREPSIELETFEPLTPRHFDIREGPANDF